MGKWAEDMEVIYKGTRLLFLNDLKGAEAIFQQAMLNCKTNALPKGLNNPTISNGIVHANSLSSIAEEEQPHEMMQESNERDLRGVFALQYALVSVIKGVASLANDQLDECLQRLWEADQLSKSDNNWIGNKVIRGVATLIGGLMQCLQHSFVKGVYNIVKSWIWIKYLPTEGLHAKGKEAEVVRSMALFALGIFNVMLSLLPRQMLRAASFVTGFEGNRDEGLKLLRTCWKEDGMLSPWAALGLVSYIVDTKTFIGERQSKSDFNACDEIFEWARKKYPNSVFFGLIEADLYACRKNLQISRQITNNLAPYVGKELKALEALLNYKRGVYALADLDFENGAKFFENALNVYVDAGRRSLVPCMAMYSGLCYMIIAEHQREYELDYNNGFVIDPDEEDIKQIEGRKCLIQEKEEITMNSIKAAAHAEEMLSIISKYRTIAKNNWGRQDLWAFSLHERYDTNIENQWPLLDMVDCMVLRMRCSRWLNDEEADRLLRLVKCEENERENIGPDERIRVCAYFAEILNKRGKHDDSLA